MGLRWSKKGAKDNTKTLAWSKYIKYILEGEEYYIKQKAYITYCDGWIDETFIVKSTYENAVKRGKHECEEIVIEKDILAVSMESLILIYGEKYKVKTGDAVKPVYKAKETIELIRKYFDVNLSTEYRIFNKVFNYHIKTLEKERSVI